MKTVLAIAALAAFTMSAAAGDLTERQKDALYWMALALTADVFCDGVAADEQAGIQHFGDTGLHMISFDDPAWVEARGTAARKAHEMLNDLGEEAFCARTWAMIGRGENGLPRLLVRAGHNG